MAEQTIEVKALKPNIYYTCHKTLDSFIWNEVDDTQNMTLEQLKIMKIHHPKYFSRKWLYVDEETQIKLGIQKYYMEKFTANDYKLLFSNDVEAVKKKLSLLLNKAEMTVISTKIKRDVQNGKITNVHIIRMLEKKFGLDLFSLT